MAYQAAVEVVVGLTESQREAWLELAEIDERERHPLAALTFMGDLQHGDQADNGAQHREEGR